MHKAVV